VAFQVDGALADFALPIIQCLKVGEGSFGAKLRVLGSALCGGSASRVPPRVVGEQQRDDGKDDHDYGRYGDHVI